ncbi:sulfatase-like hydrolase/transferase [Paenibacillus koleovorans]|uniref:sulfatase-like hydrolase/transferase n=1 Tax=Paenibacillus koleovorans TaxID=121608 RepID=UPI0013E3DAE1|nr:sulfatase-like hydrolase/transferase [Paenibacillus koleovorans]
MTKPVDKPNILWIFSDQHRPHAISCYGDKNIRTPNMDRLAEEGIRFNCAYSNTPICSPFRASLYTGKYITSHGVVSLHVPPNPGQRMLAQELQDYGYHTSHMGKWHISGGAAPSHFVSPYFRPGWNDWLGFECSNRPWETMYSTGTAPTPHKTMKGFQTDVLTDFTVDWIHSRAGNPTPWFHVVSIEPPHPPHTAPEPYMEMFRDRELTLRPNVPLDHPELEQWKDYLRAYYAQIANLDHNIGRMLNALEETGQLDNTILFYFADHGDMMGSHGKRGKTQPEVESSQIPLLIRYPKQIPAGQVSDGLISGVDLMPTLLGLIGAPIPSYVEGSDLSETVRGLQAEGAKSVVLQFEKNFWAEDPVKTFRTLVEAEWFYTVYLLKGPTQLFHMKEDPYQMNNLIDDPAYAEVKARMDAALRERLSELGDDFFLRLQALEAREAEVR